MDVVLSPVEARVLGSLIEKELTTPDYYPLTLNALTAACNQKSNRDPVMALDQKEVVTALDNLREKHLAWHVTAAGSRVPKYKHDISNMVTLSPQELAVLCGLLLRGPQTVGELRTRSARLHDFSGLEEVETALADLADREDGPYVARLPRQPGRREARYAHLLCGEVETAEADVAPPAEPARRAVQAENERLAALEEQVSSIRTELDGLKEQFEQFRHQFE
jgi:uncharacterized protein YceH (UPF0502 family)